MLPFDNFLKMVIWLKKWHLIKITVTFRFMFGRPSNFLINAQLCSSTIHSFKTNCPILQFLGFLIVIKDLFQAKTIEH